MRITTADGRLLQDGQFMTSAMAPTMIDLPVRYHGLALIQLQDKDSGTRYVLRAVVP
jgi:hypothetical protein